MSGRDVFSWEDVEAHCRDTSVAGTMVARGALIKPWVFTEIKEKRTWDISSSERLDMLKRSAVVRRVNCGCHTA